MEIIGESVQHPFEVGNDVVPPLLEGRQPRHQDATGVSPGLRLGAETDLAGDHGGPQIPLGHVVLGGDPPGIGPVIEPVGMGPAALLEAAEAEVARRCVHRRHHLRVACDRRPGARGVRERWGASPHRQGELRGHRTDTGGDLGRVGERLCQVWDLAQPMALAVLAGTGDRVVATVASHDATAGPPGLAAHRLGDAGRPGWTAHTQAEAGGSAPPGIAMFSRRPPAGCIGRCAGGRAVCLEQPIRKANTQAGDAVDDRHHTARAQVRLCAHVASGEAIAIVPGGGCRQPWIPLEALGQDRGGSWWEGPTAVGAVPLRQPRENPLGLYRVTCDDGPAVRPLVRHERVARGTAGASYRRAREDPLRLPRVNGRAPRPRLPRPCTRRLGGRRRRGVRLDGQLGRRRRRAEKPLRGLPCLGAARLLQTWEGLGAPIDRRWLRHTRGTPVNRHDDSDPTTSGATPDGGHTGTVAPRPGACKRAAPGATRHAPQRTPGKRHDTGTLGTAQANTATSVWMTVQADAQLSQQWSHRGKIHSV